MTFVKGKQKTGGRKRGTPNKTSADLKTRILDLVGQQFEVILKDLELLEPKERVAAYMKFLEYVLPKQRETKLDLSSLTDDQIEELLERAMNKID